MSYPTDDARHPPTRTKLSSTTNTYPFIIIQQLPVLATFTPALNAKHSLEYSLPSHPHTGEYSLVQADFVEVQVGPFEQDVVHAPRLLESARSIREVAAAGDAKVVAMMTVCMTSMRSG